MKSQKVINKEKREKQKEKVDEILNKEKKKIKNIIN